jgi:hypothetical protein
MDYADHVITGVSNSRYLSYMASHDVGSSIHLSLKRGQHLHQAREASSFSPAATTAAASAEAAAAADYAAAAAVAAAADAAAATPPAGVYNAFGKLTRGATYKNGANGAGSDATVKKGSISSFFTKGADTGAAKRAAGANARPHISST